MAISMALWSLDRRVTVPLAILMLLQWSLVVLSTQGLEPLLHTYTYPLSNPFIDGVFSSFYALSGNRITEPWIPSMFIYTIVFDILIILLFSWKVFWPITKRTRLVTRILKDGLVYFLLV